MLGITVRRTVLLKTPDLSRRTDENGFNLNVECSLLPCTRLEILSKENNMYRIHSEYASGYICTEDAACGNCPDKNKFAIVTDKSVNINDTEYFMSTKIPVENGRLKLPVNDSGKLRWIFKDIPDGVSLHTLKNTPQNIISQAAKLLDMPYDWGEEHFSVDCSAFTKYVYATVGTEIPRNSIDQKPFAAKSAENAKTGDIIYIPGHVMIYIDGGFVIHASHSAGKVCISKL